MFKFTLQLNIKLHDKRTQKVSTLIDVIDKPYRPLQITLQTE